MNSIYCIRRYHKVSRLFRPVVITPKDAKLPRDISVKQKLLEDMGFISRREYGMYAILPLGMRVLEKITCIINEEMSNIQAQKLSLPFLTGNALWQITGRDQGTELFKLQDRENRKYILGPTHEESITDLVCNAPEVSSNVLPLRVYQINNKFRDEIRPRFGLIRSRDFLMKDLYTFDLTKEDAKQTYEEVNEAYKNIFKRIGIPVIKVEGDCGEIGGSLSHEYHYAAKIGDDQLLQCKKCNLDINKAMTDSSKCPQCQSDMSLTKGIEVGHTFLLGTKYSKALTKTYKLSKDPLEMGCYGIGISRLLGASVEVLSTEKTLKWPEAIVPYKICIISSNITKYEASKTPLFWQDYYIDYIKNNTRYSNDIIVDDRYNLTLGKRVLDAKRCGYPIILVLGKKTLENEPIFEVVTDGNNTQYLPEDALKNFLTMR